MPRRLRIRCPQCRSRVTYERKSEGSAVSDAVAWMVSPRQHSVHDASSPYGPTVKCKAVGRWFFESKVEKVEEKP